MTRLFFITVSLAVLVAATAGCSARFKRINDLEAQTAGTVPTSAPLSKVNLSESQGEAVFSMKSADSAGIGSKSGNESQLLTLNMTLALPNAERIAEKTSVDSKIASDHGARSNVEWYKAQVPYFDKLEQVPEIDQNLRYIMQDSWPLLNLGGEYADPIIPEEGKSQQFNTGIDFQDNQDMYPKGGDCTAENTASGASGSEESNGPTESKSATSTNGVSLTLAKDTKNDSKKDDTKEQTQPANKRKRQAVHPNDRVRRLEFPGAQAQAVDQLHNELNQWRSDDFNRQTNPVENTAFNFENDNFEWVNTLQRAGIMPNNLQGVSDSDLFAPVQSVEYDIDPPMTRSADDAFAPLSDDALESSDVTRFELRAPAAKNDDENKLISIFGDGIQTIISNNNDENVDKEFEFRVPVHYVKKSIPDADGSGHDAIKRVVEISSGRLLKKMNNN